MLVCMFSTSASYAGETTDICEGTGYTTAYTIR